MQDLKDRVATVTGGCSGIGRAICVELAKCGCDIAVIDIASGPPADSLAQEIRDFGCQAFLYQADVANFQKAQECPMAVMRELGRVDFLINNAGVHSDAAIWKMTEEQWDRVIDVNLKGAFNYTRAFAPIMRERRSGCTANIGSQRRGARRSCSSLPDTTCSSGRQGLPGAGETPL